MKQDQLAFACATLAEEEHVKVALGLTNAEWIEDKVTARCTVRGEADVINVAHLKFCQAYGMQFELIRYLRGKSWIDKHMEFGHAGMISHVGFHLDDGEAWPEMRGCQLVQEAQTISHTNNYLITGAAAGRRYHYKIYEMMPGVYVKYIRRIAPATKGR